MEFQATQNQLAWVASRGHETSHHLALVEWELKCLWVMVRLEQKYMCHLIKEHLAPLQHTTSQPSCQCPIVGDFQQSLVPASFRELNTEVSSGHASPPPLKSCSSRDSFISFWEEVNAIVDPEMPTVEQESGLLHEVEASDAEASEEAWEDVSEGCTGGGSSGREAVS